MKAAAWLAPGLGAAGFVALAAVFAVETSSFRRALVDWARRDLANRAEMASSTLLAPLRTSDFRRLHAYGESCGAEGLRLTVLNGPKGIFYDSAPSSAGGAERFLAETRRCGEYEVRLSLPLERVLAPFRRARLGFILAALAGGFGMTLVFLVTYRQRVRIAELTRLERFRRTFVADVSHELKTPLTGLLGAAEMLAEATDPSARARLGEMVRREGGRLNGLVQDILTLSRLESEEAAVKRCDVDLDALARETTDRFRPQAGAAGVELCGPEGSAGVVRCDGALVERALANLVSNAILHAKARRLAVTLARTPNGRFAEISVEDDGIGIPSEERERVFERFRRLDASRSSETGGTGLGLAIVRRIARLHGGDATLEPVDPHGCRFRLRLNI